MMMMIMTTTTITIMMTMLNWRIDAVLVLVIRGGVIFVFVFVVLGPLIRPRDQQARGVVQ
jgi:hypothetical protein